jgi:mannose/fructose/N-acetylgalactosamine-specific phosphotransferase system component IIC
MIYFIGAICAFFTLLTILKPHFAWSILAAISYMFLLWFVQTYPPFALGTTGNIIFISICILGAAFCLVYTINDNNHKKEKERKENGSTERERHTVGHKQTSDDYYDSLKNLSNRKK